MKNGGRDKVTRRKPPHVPCSIHADPRQAVFSYLKNHPSEKDVAVLNVTLNPPGQEGLKIETNVPPNRAIRDRTALLKAGEHVCKELIKVYSDPDPA